MRFFDNFRNFMYWVIFILKKNIFWKLNNIIRVNLGGYFVEFVIMVIWVIGLFIFVMLFEKRIIV